jgi:hypothetical protein
MNVDAEQQVAQPETGEWFGAGGEASAVIKLIPKDGETGDYGVTTASPDARNVRGLTVKAIDRKA